jgi:hypothetical protein
MTIASETAFPPKIVNAYIKNELEHFGILSGFEQMVPIFPTSPTNIEDVFKNYIGAPGVDNPLLIQFERLIRYRPSTMYRHKREQIVYYLYCTSMDKVLDAHRVIFEALDREDASAQDVNKWAIDNDISGQNIHFYNMRVYQADETRDVLELASARTVYANKIIVEYDYHRATNKLDEVAERYN